MAGSWQNSLWDLDLYLMRIIIYLQETKDMRKSSFFLSAERSKVSLHISYYTSF